MFKRRLRQVDSEEELPERDIPRQSTEKTNEMSQEEKPFRRVRKIKRTYQPSEELAQESEEKGQDDDEDFEPNP